MSDKSPYLPQDSKLSKPIQVKEWAIKKIKEGASPNKVARDIHRLFGEYVSMQTIYRWRKHYVEVTRQEIPSWYELNKSVEQKKKNRSLKWGTKEVKK